MFEIVNPVIIGTFKIKYDETSALEAAKKFWNKFSNLITNELPQTFFTMRDESGKLFHFKVKESQNGKSISDFSIEMIDEKHPKEAEAVSKKFDTLMQQTGGYEHRRRRDDDSSTDSDSSVDEVIEKFKKINRLSHKQPIAYYYYDPTIYDTKSLYMPVFTYPITPYIEMGFSTAFWG